MLYKISLYAYIGVVYFLGNPPWLSRQRCCFIIVKASGDLSNVRYTYSVGIEGTGHHAIEVFAREIANACNYSYFSREDELRHAMMASRDPVGDLSRYFHGAVLQRSRHKAGAIVYDDSSFPTGDYRDFYTPKEIRNFWMYNLPIMHKWLREALFPEENIKYHYLTRNFTDIVAGHPKLDGGIEQHTSKMRLFHEAVRQIYPRIVFDRGGHNDSFSSWRLVDFDWFDDDDKLPTLVKKWIDFFDLRDVNCDEEQAVVGIKRVRHERHQRAVYKDVEDYLVSVDSLHLPPLTPAILPLGNYSFEY